MTHGKCRGGPCEGKQLTCASESVTDASIFVIFLKISEFVSRNVKLVDQVQSHLQWPKCGTYIIKRGSMWVRCAKPWV
jgi:hypothetical protein